MTDLVKAADAVFFDMDGVLARYDRDAYDKNKGRGNGLAIYEDEPLRYFRHCEPDPYAIGLFRQAMLAGIPAYILTSVRPDISWARFDKVWWLRREMPWFDPDTRLIVASGDKAQVAMARMRRARLSDRTVLLDDFNRNLEDWARAGGRAVKYLNGVNSPGTWPGQELDGRGMPAAIFE